MKTFCAVLAGLAATLVATPSAAQSTAWEYYCQISYYRADNMWGSKNDAYKSLGEESFRLNQGAVKDFVTDWKYEKKRNDGTTFYGSHARLLANHGNHSATFFLSQGPLLGPKQVVLPPNSSVEVRNDIISVVCRSY